MVDYVPLTSLLAGNNNTVYPANLIISTSIGGNVVVNNNVSLDPTGNLIVNSFRTYTNITSVTGNVYINSLGHGLVFPDGTFQTTASTGGGGGGGTPGGTDRAIQFNNAGSFGGDVTKLSVDTNGNIGIGTSAPLAILDVRGDALVNGITVGRGGGSVSTNTAVGYHALFKNTTGTNNTVFGWDAFANATDGYNTVAFGYQALNKTLGSYGSPNHAFGYKAMYSNTNGYYNHADGYQALYNITTGRQNLAIGWNTMYRTEDGGYNLAIGWEAMYNSVSAFSNHAVGYTALHEVTTGYGNQGEGTEALYGVTTGRRNVAQGPYTANHITTGEENTADGYAAMNSVTTTSYNSSFGAYSMYTNKGSSNSAFGHRALNYATGNTNCAFGTLSLAEWAKDNNTAFGYKSLYQVGYNIISLGDITGGSGYTNGTYTNIILWSNTGWFTPSVRATIIVSGGSVTSVTITNSPKLTEGNPTYLVLDTPTALGAGGSNFKVNINLAGGDNNTAIGYQAGSDITIGERNTLLGSYTGNTAPISQTGSNYVVLSDGGGNVRLYSDPNGNIGIGTTSATVSTKLGVYGGNISVGSTGYGYIFPDGSFQTTAASSTPPGGTTGAIQYNNSGTFGGDVNKLSFDTNGNVGIGTASSLYGLYVNGSVNIASTTTIGNVTSISSNSVTTGGLTLGIATKTSGYTLTSGDRTILGNAYTSGFTLTLPTATVNSGRVYTIKKIDATTNPISIMTTSSQTIDGSYNMNLTAQFATLSVQSDGSNWWVI